MGKYWIVRRCVGAALIGGMLLSFGCASAGQIRAEKTGAEQMAAGEFDAYVDEMFRESVVKNTINLHYTLAHPENYGIGDYEVSLGEISMEEVEKNYEELHALEEELSQFDKEALREDQRITYDILMDYAETELSVEDMILYTEFLRPTGGYQSQLPVVLAEYTFRTRQDIEDCLTLTEEMDDLFADVIAFEKQKAQAGLFMPDYTVDALIVQCDKFVEDPQSNYMIEVFNDKIDKFDGLSEEERQSYKERNTEFVTTQVTDGFRMLSEELSALRGSGKNELGLCHYADGKKYYEYLVRTATGSDDSVNQMMDRTEQFIRTGLNEMRLLFTENPQLLERSDNYEFPVKEPGAIMEDLMAKVAKDFPEPPKTAYTIKYVAPSMQEFMNPAFYMMTPVDDSQNNVIYINEKYLGDGALMDLYPTMAHEGYPGHLYQNCYTNSCDLPLIRNMFSYSGYAEGWATYVEHYSYGISGLESELAKLISVNEALTLGLYAYVDMGIHYKGWDRADVADYLKSYGIADGAAVDEMFETIVGDPANYLSYFIGYLEMRDLRETAQKALGEKFVLKDFHQFLLETGPAPFYIIEDYMRDWIKEQKQGR